MQAVAAAFAWNLLLGALLAMVVWLACRWRALRGLPALCHGLWLLVLLKLVTPPFVAVPLLPAAAFEQRQSVESSAPVVPTESEVSSFGDGAVNANKAAAAADKKTALAIQPVTDRVLSARTAWWVAVSGGWHWVLWGLAISSLLVSLSIGLAEWRSVRRLRRWLQAAGVDRGRAADLLQETAANFNLPAPPRVLIVEAAVAPMLWGERGRPVVILPQQLSDAFSDEQLRSIFAHELGHFVRRDPWANLFAFAVTTLFWWNPVAWLARRELAAAAEACCDALALDRVKGSRQTYAKTLLAVVDFITQQRPLHPNLGIAFGRSHALQRRVEALANAHVRPGLPRNGWVLLAVMSGTLVIWPIRAQQPIAPDVPGPAAESPQPVAEERYFVTGRVFDEQSGEPIAGADVRFFVDDQQDPKKRLLVCLTDAEGRYRVEAPLGSFELSHPYLKPGYWLEYNRTNAMLVTSPAAPVATRDIPARRGATWPVRVVVEGGSLPGEELFAHAAEVEDDKDRQSWLKDDYVSFKKRPATANSLLNPNGTGEFTQPGESGKLIVSIYGEHIEAMMTKFLVQPGFDASTIASIAPVADTDKTIMTDRQNRTATIGRAEVALENGRPRFTFRVARKAQDEVQTFTGRIVDSTGAPIESVRIGAVTGNSQGGSSDSGQFTVTDGQGRFTLNLAVPDVLRRRILRRNLYLQLVLTKEGYAGFDSPRIKLTEPVDEPIDVGAFTMKPGASAKILVVDARGTPLAGAVVEPGHEYARRRQAIRTDRQGRCVIRNLPAGVMPLGVRYGALAHEASIKFETAEAAEQETIIRVPDPK